MGIHSQILVHWTGKGFEDSSVPNKPQLYVDRLKDDLARGLFTKRTEEDAVREWKVKHLARICFTEIRLSQAVAHAGRYGRLGLGFTRDFVMTRGGRPVIYIPFGTEPDCRSLEQHIRDAWENSKDYAELHRSLKWIMTFVKRMSSGKDNGSDDYYEEMEWRLVYDEDPENRFFAKGDGEGIYRLPFSPRDLKVIVFPDEDTRRLALEDAAIRRHFAEHVPIMVTLEECLHF